MDTQKATTSHYINTGRRHTHLDGCKEGYVRDPASAQREGPDHPSWLPDTTHGILGGEKSEAIKLQIFGIILVFIVI